MTKLVEITLDFETYYSKKEKYSLAAKDMTYERYIRDKRFEVIGLATKVEGKLSQFLAPHEIQEWLDHVEIAYGWDNVRLIAHNARFDCAILGWKYGVYPKQIADTMLMSRAIKRWDSHSLDNLTKELRQRYNWGMWYEDGRAVCGKVEDFYVDELEDKGTEVHEADGKHLMDFTDEEYDAYANYAMKDVDLTWSAYKWFVNEWKYPEKEIDVMTYTIEMFTYPIMELDKAVLLEVQKDVHVKRDGALKRTGLSLEEVRSDVKFAEALQRLGIEPPTKLNTKGETKYAFAKTDVAFQKLLDHENEDVVNLVNARLNNKSSQVVTRVQSFIEMAERGALPIPIEYYAAHTGRWGGCLTANTMVYVRNDTHKYQLWKPIVTVAPDDLVFDGDKFVKHGGVEYRGVQRTMNYLGISGTHNHPMLLKDGTYSPLEEVYEDMLPLHTVGNVPTVPDGYYHTDIYLNQKFLGLEEPVYDLVDCGDLHRFAIKAWGKIYVAHNSDKLNPQNLNRNVLVGPSTQVGQLVFYKGKADRFVKLLPDEKVYLAKHGVVDNNEEDLHVVGLRDAFKAPKGKVLVVLDLSQIELRMNAYVAGEQWVLDTLVAGKDIYKAAASKSFGVAYEDVTKTQRYVGKQQELLLGYGGGENAIVRGIGKKAEDFSPAELKSWVTLYRETHPYIRKQWQRMQTVFLSMAQGVSTEVDPSNILLVEGDSILLPNGMRIVYRGIRAERGANGFNEIYFWGKNKVTGKPDWEKTFGGKGVENCIAEDTEVLTDRGWVAIQNITLEDKVFDGVEFVNHSGILFKSVQPCVIVDGVYMTEDHEVLTNEGWKPAANIHTPSIQRLNRTTLWEISRFGSYTLKRKTILDLPMRLWQQVSERSPRCTEGLNERKNTELWVLHQRNDDATQQYSLFKQTPDLCGMAVYESSLFKSEAQGLAQLWWSGYNRVSKMARQLREFSGRYAPKLPTKLKFRPYRQQWGVLQGELSVGYTESKRKQSTPHSNRKDVRWNYNDSERFLPNFWGKAYNIALSFIKGGYNAPSRRTSKCEKKVYDILNCGPRQRFVVKGLEGPMIVHNCTQALSRIILSDAMYAMREEFAARGWGKDKAHLAMQVHDEVITCCDEDIADEVYTIMEDCLTRVPKWAEGLPLACDGDIVKRYGCAK